MNAGSFQQMVSFEHTDPVLPPSGQAQDDILGQVSDVEHEHTKGHVVPDSLFEQLDRQHDCGLKLFVPWRKLESRELYGVDLFIQAIPTPGVGQDLDLWKMLRHTSCPPGQFLIAAIAAQAREEAHQV